MKVKARLNNDGGYDGLKHVTFPVEVYAYANKSGSQIDVPMGELERIGYDKEAGLAGVIPDQLDMTKPLTFIIPWGEADIIE